MVFKKVKDVSVLLVLESLIHTTSSHISSFACCNLLLCLSLLGLGWLFLCWFNELLRLLWLIGTNRSSILFLSLHFLNVHGKLHELIHLCLGVLNILVISWKDLSYDLVGFLLVIKCLSEIIKLEVGMCNGLITTGDLNVILTKNINVSV